MSTKYLTEEQKEFYAELEEKCNDKVDSIEMICFDTSKAVFESLGLRLPAGRKTLWAILVFGEKNMHIYVTPTETTILGFKVGNQRKSPKEQVFSFEQFSSWNIEPIMKKTLFGLKAEKYSLQLHFSYNSERQEEVKGSMLLQVQTIAKDTLFKMQKYQK